MRSLSFRLMFAIVIVGLVSFTIGCSSDEDEDEDTAPTAVPAVAPTAAPTLAPAAATPTETPKTPKVARLVFGLDLTTETNSPGRASATFSNTIPLRVMYEYLIGVNDKTGQYEPGLATDWTIGADGTSITFNLRSGVPFHGGYGTFSAADVLWTMEDMTAEDSIHPQKAIFDEVIGSVDILSDTQIRFNMNRPSPEAIDTFSALSSGGMEIQSKAHFDVNGTVPTIVDDPIAGTGPYHFKERTQSSFIRFERTPYDHWRIRPDFAEFEWRIIPENSTRLAALLTEEIHIADLPTDLRLDASAFGMVVVTGQVPTRRMFFSFECCYIDAETGQYVHPESPLLDVRVRKALNKAINRDELNEALFNGDGQTLILNHIKPTMPTWNDDWDRRYPEEYGFDPAAARALLAEAGYTSSNPLKTSVFVFSRFPGAEDVIEASAGYWMDIGVDVNLLTIEIAQYNEKRRAFEWDNHINILASSSNPLLGIRVYNSIAQPRIGFEDAALDVIFPEIRRTIDKSRQNELFRQWGDRAYELHPNIPLLFIPTEMAVNPDIVAGWSFPGNIGGSWTHIENIKAVLE